MPASRRLFDSSSRLQKLANDVRDAEIGANMLDAIPSDAPTLHDWSFRWTTALALTGEVIGHPVIENRHTILTSDLYAIDLVEGWARTHTRFFRLGRAIDERELQHG